MTSDVMREHELRAFVSWCFVEFATRKMSVRAIAEASRLCTTTIYRLKDGRATLASHFGTIQAIGDVAGVKLLVSKRSVKMVARRRVA
jgi:hypothetical protein